MYKLGFYTSLRFSFTYITFRYMYCNS